MAKRLGQLYRETYGNALALAQQAATAYMFERGGPLPTLAQGAWSAGHAGLLAAESLQADLADLERRFLETDQRLLEVEQHFSLAQIHPWALQQLRSTGTCSFTLPEVYFDVAYPGQYNRRIKAVRISVPCVVGPFTNVSATLTLSPKTGHVTTSDGAFGWQPDPVTAQIATSTGQRDAGLFELSMRDERYLPFEGAGAVDSQWTLRLPGALRSFDYDTISDVILHLSYTARHDTTLRSKKEGAIAATIDQAGNALRRWLGETNPTGERNSLTKVFSARRDFPNAWPAALAMGAPATLSFDVRPDHFPLLLQPLLSGLKAHAEVWRVTTKQRDEGIEPEAATGWSAGNPPPPAGTPATYPVIGVWTVTSPTGSNSETRPVDVLLKLTITL
jgi:hypothetical protein